MVPSANRGRQQPQDDQAGNNAARQGRFHAEFDVWSAVNIGLEAQLFLASGRPILRHLPRAAQALNAQLRRAVRARGHFPNDDAATKLLYLILNRSEKEWKMPPREWSMAKAQFAVLFGERFIKAMAA